jgi:glycosyltransferase involved in cell wall biosynthesis
MRIAISAISFCEYLIQQANALARLGHSVLLIMPASLVDNTVGVDIKRLLVPTVHYYTYNVAERWRLDFYRELFRTMAVFSPDILHIHENGEIETLALICRFYKIPLVVTIHDITLHPGADSKLALRRRWIIKYLNNKADVIHLHGFTLQKKLAVTNPVIAAKSMIVPHGALSLFRQWEDGDVKREPLNCLFFGRMEKYRGLDNLLKIGHALKEVLPGIRIVVAGRGSELEKHKAEMTAIGIFEVYDTFIPDKDIHRFFRRSSLLLLPYHEASQSGVISMGLPFGVPVVATDVGSIPEIIIDGQHGRIVPVGDLDGFACAVRELLRNDDCRARMASECLKLSESLSFECLANDFNSLYAHAIAVKEK